MARYEGSIDSYGRITINETSYESDDYRIERNPYVLLLGNGATPREIRLTYEEDLVQALAADRECKRRHMRQYERENATLEKRIAELKETGAERELLEMERVGKNQLESVLEDISKEAQHEMKVRKSWESFIKRSIFSPSDSYCENAMMWGGIIGGVGIVLGGLLDGVSGTDWFGLVILLPACAAIGAALGFLIGIFLTYGAEKKFQKILDGYGVDK